MVLNDHIRFFVSRSLIFVFILLGSSAVAKDSLRVKKPNEWIGMRVGLYGGPVLANMRSHEQFFVGDNVWRSNFGISFQVDLSRVVALEFDVDVMTKGYTLQDTVLGLTWEYLYDRTVNTKCTYLGLPVLLKLNIRKQSGLFFTLGGHFSVQMGSQMNKQLRNESEFVTEKYSGFQKFPFDVGLIVGLGAEFRVKKYLLGLETRYNMGFGSVTSLEGYPYQHHQNLSMLITLKRAPGKTKGATGN